MDFFAQQDRSRKKTGLLALYFGAAVATTILMVYLVPLLGLSIIRTKTATASAPPQQWWIPELFFGVCGATLLVVLCGTLYKIGQLKRGGGRGVAEMLGGKEVLPSTEDFFERRLRNVVEEMAIASGVPVPSVYVLPREKGINAFAAGFTPSDSVVAVTYTAMTGLTRDELQGVVAHEFSHILNTDMAINIQLMGFLHGLLLIGLTGRLVLELAHDSHDNKGGLLVLAAGLGLMGIGFTGVLFGKAIKASISRTRERLADASAVQFTRNPAGLASALKKIGGLSEGSRLRSPRAEQASHMFFGNGLRGGMFSTHPPLKQRVRWLEPTFGGNFPSVTYADLREQLIRYEGAPKEVEKEKEGIADLFTKPMGVAGAAIIMDSVAKPKGRPTSPHALLESIGRPMEHHAEAARALIASIPDEVRKFTTDAYGARMLIYFLLLDHDEAILKKQMSILEGMAEPEVFQTLHEALPHLNIIKPEQRLPIIDLTIPALRFLSTGQYQAFMQTVKALVEADNRIDVFEYALQRVLTHHLDPLFAGEVRRPAANYYSIRGLVHETSVLLSVLARKGHSDEAEATAAFQAAAGVIDEPKAVFQFVDAQNCTWDVLDEALDKINEGSHQIKKLVLSAALTCLMHDREITVAETELFRAVADTLGCPVPPWVTPLELED